MSKVKAFMKKLPDRVKESLFYLLLPIPVYTVLGFIWGSAFFLLDKNGSYLYNIWTTILGSYVGFGGACLALHGILLLMTKPTSTIPIGISAGLFYGTIFLASFLQDYITTAEVNLYIISFVIVALICYIIWLKWFKEK